MKLVCNKQDYAENLMNRECGHMISGTDYNLLYIYITYKIYYELYYDLPIYSLLNKFNIYSFIL